MCGERITAAPCNAYCSFGSTGPCQHVNLGDEMCADLLDDGACPSYMQNCGFRPSREWLDGPPSPPPSTGVTVDATAICAVACDSGTSGPCKHINLGDNRCMQRESSGNCQVGTVDCVWGTFIEEDSNIVSNKSALVDQTTKVGRKAKKARKVAKSEAKKDERTAAIASDMASKLQKVANVAKKMAQREEEEVAEVTLAIQKLKVAKNAAFDTNIPENIQQNTSVGSEKDVTFAKLFRKDDQ